MSYLFNTIISLFIIKSPHESIFNFILPIFKKSLKIYIKYPSWHVEYSSIPLVDTLTNIHKNTLYIQVVCVHTWLDIQISSNAVHINKLFLNTPFHRHEMCVD